MLNEELFDNKKDARIADLTQKSEAFKRHNEKRKEQYRKAQIRLSKSKEPKLSFDDPIIWKKMGSMEDDDPIHAIENLVKAKNAKIHELQNKFSVELLEKDKEINNLKLEILELKAKIGE